MSVMLRHRTCRTQPTVVPKNRGQFECLPFLLSLIMKKHPIVSSKALEFSVPLKSLENYLPHVARALRYFSCGCRKRKTGRKSPYTSLFMKNSSAVKAGYILLSARGEIKSCLQITVMHGI